MSPNLTKTSCRVCFTECTVEATNVSDVRKLFCESVGYRIHSADIPQKLCFECLESIFEIQKFKEKCHKAEIVLQKFRIQEKNFVKVPERVFTVKKEEDSVTFARSPKIDKASSDEKPNTTQLTPKNPKPDDEKPTLIETPSIVKEKPKVNIEQKVMCEKCGETVKKRHLYIHNSKHEETPYECDICGKTYNYKSNLAKHMISHKTEPKNPHQCHKCNQIFNNYHTLYYHIKIKHKTAPFKHVCEICGRDFPKSSMLNDHRALHLGVRNHPCDTCDAIFMNKTRLSEHKKNSHSTQTFSCKICNKSFKNRRLVRQHMHSHQPNKYKCPVCAQSFSANHALRGHVAQKHPEYEMPPPGTILRHTDINELMNKRD